LTKPIHLWYNKKYGKEKHDEQRPTEDNTAPVARQATGILRSHDGDRQGVTKRSSQYGSARTLEAEATDDAEQSHPESDEDLD